MRILKSSPFLSFAVLIVVGTAHVFGMAGQSGRKPPPELPAAPTEPSLAAFVPDPNRDEYQFVFSKGYQELKKGEELTPDQQWQHYIADFIDELNRLGAQGYRVTSIAVS